MAVYWQNLQGLPVSLALALAGIGILLMLLGRLGSERRARRRRLARAQRHHRQNRDWQLMLWLRRQFGIGQVRRLTDQRDQD